MNSNKSFYAPYRTWENTPEAWMGLNDVNILTIDDDIILYEYAYLNDNRKWWAKTFLQRDPALSPAEELPYIIQSVEDIRRIADERGRANGE